MIEGGTEGKERVELISFHYWKRREREEEREEQKKRNERREERSVRASRTSKAEEVRQPCHFYQNPESRGSIIAFY
ncbi:hypothetical protein AAC387_Pa02g4854 [Persea americana]